jgi:hypothetical protein
MKKITFTVILLALLLGLNSYSYSQSDSSRCNRRGDFVDKNKDGVCDNINTQNRGGRNFVDKNNDGTCDNHQTLASNDNTSVRNGKCDGTGKGNGYGYGCRNNGKKGNACCKNSGNKCRNKKGNNSSGNSSTRKKALENAVDWSIINN